LLLDETSMAGQGPATAREIYDAIKAGGYVFEAKDATTALVGMRALLRTQPNVFHRLPQGTWGLTAWYPDAKKPKDEPKKKSAAARKSGAAKKLRSTARKRERVKLIEGPTETPVTENE
jgi:hypothetical protein